MSREPLNLREAVEKKFLVNPRKTLESTLQNQIGPNVERFVRTIVKISLTKLTDLISMKTKTRIPEKRRIEMVNP